MRDAGNRMWRAVVPNRMTQKENLMNFGACSPAAAGSAGVPAGIPSDE